MIEKDRCLENLRAEDGAVCAEDTRKMWENISSRMSRIDAERAKEVVWLRNRREKRRQMLFLFACGGFFDLQISTENIVCYTD